MTDGCPRCGSKPCYIPIIGNIECSNPKCSSYSKELYPPPPPPATPSSGEENKNKPEKKITVYSSSYVINKDANIDDDGQLNFVWSNYHHDFGDI